MTTSTWIYSILAGSFPLIYNQDAAGVREGRCDLLLPPYYLYYQVGSLLFPFAVLIIMEIV